MDDLAHHFREEKRWRERAIEHYAKADNAVDEHCRDTLLRLAQQADVLANRAASFALRMAALAEREAGMQSAGGLHPYRAGLLFILREQQSPHRSSRKARAAVVADDINAICKWPLVRMLAHQFDKTAREVARELTATFRALEVGQPAP